MKKVMRICTILLLFSTVAVCAVFDSPVFANNTDIKVEVPTPSPTPIDLCLNLPGDQETIPDGYYRTELGNCYRQTLPPVDICPNLDDVQTAVPDGYYLDSITNTCLPIVEPSEPPTPPSAGDLCLNIPGIQETVPSGMISEDGNCTELPEEPTPSPSPSPSPSPTNPGTTGPTEQRPDLPNVPNFLQPVAHAIVDLIPENVQEFFRELPPEVVNQIPLYVFVVILILILIPLIQAIREYLYRRRLLALYKREKDIAEEKDNFITLASHYVRTPLAIMRDSASLMLGAEVIDTEQSESINNTINNLGDQIDKGLEAANKNPALKTLPDPNDVPKPKPFWRSVWFWLPIALSIVLTLIVNFLIGVVGEKQIGGGITWFQILIIIGFIVVVYLLVRNYYIQKRLRQENKVLIEREEAIDRIRNKFIGDQAANISTAMGALFFTAPSTPPPPTYNIYSAGLSRLSNIHDKFILLAQVKTGANRNITAFDLKTAIERAIGTRQADISAKELTVENSVGSIQVTQNEALFSFVISSVLDNAIKFTESGGRITISSEPERKTIQVKVSDNGQGIDPAKLDQLFKPFSRAESAVDFSYEGLGLSLFLDRLILTYTGGSISAKPRLGGGTDVVITTPIEQKQPKAK